MVRVKFSTSTDGAGLAIVQIGSRADSNTYIRMKQKAAKAIGVLCELIQLPDTVTEAELLALLDKLNRDTRYHGIIVQAPLPAHISTENVVAAVDPAKDVDGFSPECMGRLATLDHDPCFIPCTPKGVLRLLTAYGVDVAGKKIVIVGRSRVVGLPMALLMLRHDATVTVCHKRTLDTAAECRSADILISAAGKAELIRGDWVRPGAVVIDVGINYRPLTSAEEQLKASSATTPSPKGAGSSPSSVM